MRDVAGSAGTHAVSGRPSAALALVTSPQRAKPLVAVMLVLFVGLVAFLLAPWRQTAAGSGVVTSFAPGVRPQRIEAQISGRIVRWHVAEGAEVHAGQLIAELRDVSPSFLDPEFADKLAAVRDATEAAQRLAVEATRERTRQAAERVVAAEAAERNAQVELETARVRHRRAERLAQRGLVATRDLESAVLALRKAEAELVRTETAHAAAKQELAAFRAEEARAVAAADAVIADAALRAGSAEARRAASEVRAPVDGTVVRVSSAGPGEIVTEGTELASIVPATDDVAAAITVSALDAALITPGARARLQFAGFPALQISGWSSVAIGTYGGVVKVIDAVDDGAGRYRVLIVPDPDDAPWPPRPFLRQGTGVTAWVLLQRVTVGWEIWRQLNGLPPTMPPLPQGVGKGK